MVVRDAPSADTRPADELVVGPLSRLRRKPTHPIRVLHFISNSYPSDYFPVIARHTDHERFVMQVGSLDRSGGLQDQLAAQGVPTFALGVESRARYPLAALRLASRLRSQRVDVLHTHLFEASLVGLS